MATTWQGAEGWGVCWWCHWGWPKEVADIYLKAIEELEGLSDWGNTEPYNAMRFEFAHIVWEDENWDSARWCIEEGQNHRERYKDITDEQFHIIMKSLHKLLELDESVFNVIPDDYDDRNPENYPPLNNAVMVKV